MSFDIFENIYTASDPAGGRAIKVSTLTGIDNAESYYTKTDPAGGRAIKVKIIAGGASTGTLQVEGGVALDGTYRNITDSASTPNSSILQLTTGAVKVNGLFTVAGATYAADVFIRDLSAAVTTLKTTTPSTGTTNNVLSLAPLDVASSSAFYNSPALSFDVSVWNGSSAVTRSFKMFAKTFGGVSQNDPEFNIFGPTNVQLMRLNTSNLGLSVTGIAADASVGFSIATATTQKIAFWGATPIVQPTNTVAAATIVANSGANVHLTSTFDGYTVAQVVKALRNTGLLQ